jgi:hypothetical protein
MEAEFKEIAYPVEAEALVIRRALKSKSKKMM